MTPERFKYLRKCADTSREGAERDDRGHHELRKMLDEALDEIEHLWTQDAQTVSYGRLWYMDD